MATPFRRAEGTKRTGLGLGLNIAHEIVAAHGGKIEVSSSPGADTTFRVWRPFGAR